MASTTTFNREGLRRTRLTVVVMLSFIAPGGRLKVDNENSRTEMNSRTAR